MTAFKLPTNDGPGA